VPAIDATEDVGPPEVHCVAIPNGVYVRCSARSAPTDSRIPSQLTNLSGHPSRRGCRRMPDPRFPTANTRAPGCTSAQCQSGTGGVAGCVPGRRPYLDNFKCLPRRRVLGAPDQWGADKIAHPRIRAANASRRGLLPIDIFSFAETLNCADELQRGGPADASNNALSPCALRQSLWAGFPMRGDDESSVLRWVGPTR